MGSETRAHVTPAAMNSGNTALALLLGLVLLLQGTSAIKKKYLDSDMDGINDADDDDDDNDGIDDDDDEEDLDGDGISNKDDNDDDGDGIADAFDRDDDDDGQNDDDNSPVVKKTAKSSNGGGPWGTIAFGYYFGLTQYLMKTA